MSASLSHSRTSSRNSSSTAVINTTPATKLAEGKDDQPSSSSTTPNLLKEKEGPVGARPTPLNELDDHTLKTRPWRRYVTPWSRLLDHHYPGQGTLESPFVVDWLPGKDEKGRAFDSENPLTWSETNKWITIGSNAFATLAVTIASSALSGAENSIEADFPGYKIQAYIMVTCAFVLGFVVGPLLWAPLSELYGRRYLFIGTYLGFSIFNAGLCGSQNIWTLIVLRFFAGTFGSSPLTNAGGVVADTFDARERGLGMAVFASAPFAGPALGPIIGGFLGTAGGWRWVAGLIAILTSLVTAAGAVIIPETYAPRLLGQRAALLSKATGHVYHSKFEAQKKVAPAVLFKTALTRPWLLLSKEPIVLLLSLYLAIIYGTLYMLFAAFPIVFEQERGWSAGVSGLAFLGPFTGFMSAIAYIIFYENPRYSRKMTSVGGWLAPEERLVPGIVGGALLPVGLFAFAWTAAPASIHWSAPIILSVPFGMGMVLVFLSVFGYLIDSYLLYAASVLAANSVIRSLFGVAFPLFSVNMYDNLGINWASTLVAFLALACAPMPILFRLYGAKVRRMTKHGREADELGQKLKFMAQQAHQKAQQV